MERTYVWCYQYQEKEGGENKDSKFIGTEEEFYHFMWQKGKEEGWIFIHWGR